MYRVRETVNKELSTTNPRLVFGYVTFLWCQNTGYKVHYNINVNQVNSSRYLGIYSDSMLNWSDHIENLCKKLVPKVGILRGLKTTLSRERLLKIYQCTIQSVIDYCITAWGFAPAPASIMSMQSLQNRAARIITGNYDRNVCGIDILRHLGLTYGNAETILRQFWSTSL